jgi:aspartyl/asparaginyl beta-hydroxylase (cupin superfamily)
MYAEILAFGKHAINQKLLQMTQIRRSLTRFTQLARTVPLQMQAEDIACFSEVVTQGAPGGAEYPIWA